MEQLAVIHVDICNQAQGFELALALLCILASSKDHHAANNPHNPVYTGGMYYTGAWERD